MTSQKLEELVGKYCDYDLHVFGPKAFYPVAWPDWKAIFKVIKSNPPGKRKRELLRNPRSTEMGYEVGPRLRELAPRGQREPGGGIHAT